MNNRDRREKLVELYDNLSKTELDDRTGAQEEAYNEGFEQTKEYRDLLESTEKCPYDKEDPLFRFWFAGALDGEFDF